MRRFESYHPSQNLDYMSINNLDIFAGSSSTDLAEDVAKLLGLKLTPRELGYFSDGEVKVEINENVRGHDTFIIQSTCAPTNKHLMEIMLLSLIHI